MKTLREWAVDNEPSKEMLWKDAFWKQVIFMRDIIGSSVLARKGDCESVYDLVKVCNTHCSKSIVCPVYYIELTNKNSIDWTYLKVWARYNFYNWYISIDCDKPIISDFLGVIGDPTLKASGCEGMSDQEFDCYADNKNRFTVDVYDNYQAYVFFRTIKQQLNIRYE